MFHVRTSAWMRIRNDSVSCTFFCRWQGARVVENCFINIRRNWCYLTIIFAFNVQIKYALAHTQCAIIFTFHLDFCYSHESGLSRVQTLNVQLYLHFFRHQCSIHAATNSSMTQNKSSNEEVKDIVKTNRQRAREIERATEKRTKDTDWAIVCIRCNVNLQKWRQWHQRQWKKPQEIRLPMIRFSCNVCSSFCLFNFHFPYLYWGLKHEKRAHTHTNGGSKFFHAIVPPQFKNTSNHVLPTWTECANWIIEEVCSNG